MAELDKFKRRVIRSVARMLFVEKRPEQELWDVLMKETGCDCRKLWERMRGLTLKKLKRLLAAEDKTDGIIPIAKMSRTDWLLFDLVLVHDEDIEVIGPETLTTAIPKPLEDLFDIVNEYEVEGKVGQALADAWTSATFAYNKVGRQCSPMLLQRRWYQMKRSARNRFYKFWYTYRGNSKLLVNAKPNMPNKLEMAVAQRYPHVVTKPFPEWNQMIENRSVILPDEFDNKLNPNSQYTAHKGDNAEPDIILLETNVETITLGDADSETESPEEGSAVAKKTKDVDYEIPLKEVVVKTEPPDDIQTYSKSLDDSLQEMNERLLESVPNIDDDEEDANSNKEAENLDETTTENDLIDTTIENVTTDIDANTENYITNIDANTENYITNADAHVEPVILTTEQKIEDSNENNVSETGTKDNSNLTKTENEVAVDHTESDVHENCNSENNVAEQLQQTIISDVNDIYVETVVKEEISEPMVMPQITNVFGNVNVATEVLIKMSEMSRESKGRNHSPTPVIATVDNVQCEPIDVGGDDDKVNEKLEVYLNSTKETKQNETKPVDSNFVQQDSTQLEQDTKQTNYTNSFLDMTVDLTFADDGIELVDDGIEYDEDDEDDIIKPLGDSHLKQEIDIAIKSETDNKESNEREENPKFDLKLLMQPVVYTTKLEEMTVFRDIDIACVSDIKLLDDALIESKPVSKSQHNIKKENEDMFDTSLPLTPDGENNGDDSLSEDEINEPEELPIHEKVKMSSYVLQKPKSRSYNPIQLCKNPDFNTRLKRLTACFLSSMRNRSFLKTLKPMTIDVSKAFENKLIEGTLYLDLESEDSTPLNKEVKDNSEQAISNLPLAMPVQRLIHNLIGQQQSTFRSTTSETNVCPKQSRDSPDLPERSRVINLPDLDNIRRMNQRLFTAEVTPMRIQGPNEKCIPPVQLVKFGTEDPENQDTGSAEVTNFNSDLPMHGIFNKTSIEEKSIVNVGSGIQKPGPKSRCGINCENTTPQQMNSADTQRQTNAEPLAKKRRIVDNADPQNSDPKHFSSIDKIGTTETTSNRYTSWMQPERLKPGPKRDDIFKPKKVSYYPAFNRKECSMMSWSNRGYVAHESPSAKDEALLTVDTLNKMLSLMEDKEPITLSKLMKANERKRFAQRKNELDGRLDEYEKRKLGLLQNKESESIESTTIITTKAKKNKSVEPFYETSLAPKSKLALSFCCWARSKIEFPKNKRRHRCPRICECCCRNELLVKTDWKFQSPSPNPSSVVISDEEDDTMSDQVTLSIDSVVQKYCTTEKSETVKDSNSIASIAKVTTSSQQVEASIQCDLDDNNLASKINIQTDINKVPSYVETNKLPATPLSVSTDVIAIDDNEDPKDICEPVVKPKRPITIKKPRITVRSKNSLLSSSPIKPIIKTYIPLNEQKKQQVNYSLNYSKRVGNLKRAGKVIYLNNKQKIDDDRGCPIYLGKNKILLTDVKFPSDLGYNDQPAVLPNFEAVQAPTVLPIEPVVAPGQTADSPIYNLPEGIQLVLHTDGKVNCIIDPFARVPMAKLQTLPTIIKAIQEQLDKSNEVVNVDTYENEEVAASVVPEKSDSFDSVNLLSMKTSSVVREDNEVATNDTINFTESIQNNLTLECNEVFKGNGTNIQSHSFAINEQSLSASQDNEEINPTPGEKSIDSSNTLLKTLEQSNKPTTSQAFEVLKTTSNTTSLVFVDAVLKTHELSNETTASQAIEESKATTETISIDCVEIVPKTLELSNGSTATQAIEELKATSRITSIDCDDTVQKILELSNKPTASQVILESETTTEINSIDCVDTVPETLEQRNEQTASQAIEQSNPITGEISGDIAVIASEIYEQNSVPVENDRRSPRPDIIENQESKIDNTVSNKNRSTLLSDLMEMSGISAEDTTLPLNENIGINIPAPSLAPLTQQVSPRHLQTSPSKILTNFCSILSFKQLKYACENNGNFFKLDLDTGIFCKINVCIQKTPQPKQTGSILKAVIDLTDDPALSDDESERPNMSNTQTLPVNPAMPAIQKPTKEINDIDNSSEPQMFVIMKSNPTKSLLKDSYHLANTAKPLKLFRSANFTNNNQKNIVSTAPVDSHLQDKNSTAKRERKQIFGDHIRLDAESLNSDDSFDSIDNYIWSTDKYLSDSDSSDDEPLALKAKRMKFLERKESSDVANNEVTQQTVDNIQNTADENISDTEESREVDAEMPREISFMSDHEGDDGNEDCILGF